MYNTSSKQTYISKYKTKQIRNLHNNQHKLLQYPSFSHLYNSIMLSIMVYGINMVYLELVFLSAADTLVVDMKKITI